MTAVRARGFNLPELMVSMAIGLVLLAAFIKVLDRCRSDFAVNESLARRSSETTRAEAIVNQEVEKFMAWARSRTAMPTVVALRQRFEAIRRAELDRLQPKIAGLPPEARARVDEITRLIIEKLLITPTEQLKALPDQELQSSYADALSEAQSLGYAERDPTADVEGYDAAAKAAIIASIAFGVRVVAGDVTNEGIAHITRADIDYAAKMGYVIKLLAIAEQRGGSDGDEVGVRVHPAMVPAEHPLASVRDSFNAVFVEGAAVGDLMFYGRGAGGFPTASAVLGDLIDAAANLRKGAHASLGSLHAVAIRPIDDARSEYYLNLEVADEPGVQQVDLFVEELAQRHLVLRIGVLGLFLAIDDVKALAD